MAPCWSGIGQLQCGLLHRVARNTAGVGDIIQEAMLIAYLTIDDLRDSNRFGPWLCGISLNLWRNQLRQQRWDQLLNMDGTTARYLPRSMSQTTT